MIHRREAGRPIAQFSSAMTLLSSTISPTRRKVVWGPKRTLPALFLFVFAFTLDASNASAAGSNQKGGNGRHHQQAGHKRPGAPGFNVKNYKVDDEVTKRANRGNPLHTSSVIVTLVPGAQLPPEFKKFARAGKLDIINGQVLDLPDNVIKQLAKHPNVFRIHDNRPIATHNYRTTITVGADVVQDYLGYTGLGIGVAIIDSGIASWHDDLTRGGVTKTYPYGDQRVSTFVDFVKGKTLPYDDNGHGTHVAGIIAGNGYDSKGEKAGIAPKASLVALKVLDANGVGSIGNIIAALNWVAVNAKTYNIRVVNMSVGAAVRESYLTDPLTLATKKVTDLGITVVTAAGNLGKNTLGQKQYGGISAPANAPWVLTVGASSTMGTLTRGDDTLAGFSSRGPTNKDYLAKPDLVAPGTGTISLAAPGSLFYATKLTSLLPGKLLLGSLPYLSLSGTSMAAPVVSGTIALMLQANPNLTPNLVKAILQYTAQEYNGYNPLEQGAGFLNSYGAVRLAKFYYSHHVGDHLPTQKIWSRHIIWGNHLLKGGYINPLGNAWRTSVTWGSAKTQEDTGDNIVWGTMANDLDNIVWGTADEYGDNIVWGTMAGDDNIVWGTMFSDDNIVWGTSDGDDNIVWGTDCGGSDCDNIVWGTSDSDNIVWGTADADDNIVWGTAADLLDNIVWGTSDDDNIVWGTSGEDATIFPNEDTEPVPDVTSEFGDLTITADSGVN
jgi:serine protease AprX